MIPTALLALALAVAVVACLMIAWHTRRWAEPGSGRSAYGRLNRQQLADVLNRHGSREADL